MLVLVELPVRVVLVVDVSTRLTLVVEPLATLVPVVAGAEELVVPRLELLPAVA
jgi:hypothetical protein